MIGGVLLSLLDPIVSRPQFEDILLPSACRECLIHRLSNYYKIQFDLKAQSLSFSIELLQQLIPMNQQPQMPRQEYIKQRNHKLASILVLLITLSEKIERLKEKLCGFSPSQFSPESIFEALDLTAKGYLDAYDIHAFLGNDKIRDRDILILFQRMGDQGTGRLTYLGYLTLLKPFFDYELARDLLMRDTVSHRKNRANEDEQNLHEMQETVLILLNQLLLLYCICIAEHEELKSALIEEYMLNEVEIKEILGIGGRVAALTAIKEFIQCNSEYEIGKEEVKYLLAFAQTSQPSLPQEKNINLLFLPSRPVQRKNKRDDEPTVKGTRNLQYLHSNYTKDYLGKADLYTTSNRLSFLNYIHPSSFEKPEKDVPSFGMEPNRIDTQPNVNAQHKKLSISQDKLVPRPFKPQKQREGDHELAESVVQQSNLHQLRKPSARLQQSSYDKIETPILQQFMHESNVKRNMGNYKSRERDLELNQVMEESSVSESDGIVRVDYTSKEERPKPAFNISTKPYEKEIRPQLASSFHQHSYLANKSNLSNMGETSGILNQFIRSQYR